MRAGYTKDSVHRVIQCGSCPSVPPPAVKSVMACNTAPYSLAEGDPYFRRSWRLAFITSCVKHRIQLLDRCPICNEPVNYRKGISGSLHNPPIGNLTLCHSCKTDLRDADFDSIPSTSNTEIDFQNSLVRTIQNGWININGSGPVYSHLYFIVLRRLMFLLASGNKGIGLRQYISRQYGNKNFDIILGNDKTLERLCVAERRGLIGMARELLSDWPNNFINFCKANKLFRGQLFTRMDNVPYWYWKVAYEHLSSMREYRQSVQEVESALKCLNKAYDHCRSKNKFPEKFRGVSKFLNSYHSPNKQVIWRECAIPDRRLKANRKSVKLYKRRLPNNNELPEPRLIPNELWEEIKSFIPPGRPYRQKVNDRTVLNGILYVLSTDCTWHEIPPQFGTWQQAQCRYQRWKRDGAFDKIWSRCSRWYGSIKRQS